MQALTTAFLLQLVWIISLMDHKSHGFSSTLKRIPPKCNFSF
eukprot:SAG31_NODE_39_length_31377_cov_5.971482_17_plen_42_part_00